MNKISRDMLQMLPTEDYLRAEVEKRDMGINGYPRVVPNEEGLDDLEKKIMSTRIITPTDCIAVILKEPFSTNTYTMLSRAPKISPEAAVTILERGVAAAKIALGDDYMAEEKGSFYSLLPTRPLIRAMYALFEIRLEMGDYPAAIELGLEAVDLNTHDNMGFRSPLATLLLRDGQTKGAQELFQKYSDDTMPGILYGRVILSLMYEDPQAAACFLNTAQKFQKHVGFALVGESLSHDASPHGTPMGGTTEAIEYLNLAAPLWKKTPGAIEFVAHETSAGKTDV